MSALSRFKPATLSIVSILILAFVMYGYKLGSESLIFLNKWYVFAVGTMISFSFSLISLFGLLRTSHKSNLERIVGVLNIGVNLIILILIILIYLTLLLISIGGFPKMD